MTINITAVGGFGEVGRNCTAVEYEGDTVLMDLGLHLDHYIKYTEDEEGDVAAGDPEILMRVGAIPDLRVLKGQEQSVKAIVLSHAHLDHIGAMPFLMERFKNVPIYGSPFTIAFLRQLLEDKDIHPSQPLRVLIPGQRAPIGKMELELIPITHSTPDSTIVALHTPEGTVVYANDFKFDNHPVIGKPLDLKPFEKLKGSVAVLISECLYAPHATKTPSEIVAREMLREVLLETKTKQKAIFVSTFSSHIARLKSIVEVANELGRKTVFLGRSPAKYIQAAKEAGIIDLTKDAMVIKYGAQARRFLKNLRDPERYLIVTTGHQGEPKAMLSRLASEEIFKWQPEDIIVFSSNVIPVPMIQANRKHLEEKLRKHHLRIFVDVHVSGHASREDLREFLDILEPQIAIPSHGDPIMTNAYVELAREQGFDNERVVALREGDKLAVPGIKPKLEFPTLPKGYVFKDAEYKQVRPKRERTHRPRKPSSHGRDRTPKTQSGEVKLRPGQKERKPLKDGPLSK
jgi:ribonuclease J